MLKWIDYKNPGTASMRLTNCDKGMKNFFYRTKSQNLDALLTIHDILIKGNC